MEPPFKLTVSLLSAAHAGTLVRAFRVKLPAAAASASARLPKYTLPRRSLCIMIVQFRLARQSVAGIGRAKPYTEQPATGSELAAKPEIEEGERTLRAPCCVGLALGLCEHFGLLLRPKVQYLSFHAYFRCHARAQGRPCHCAPGPGAVGLASWASAKARKRSSKR